jgi:hypothetical protein
LLDSAIGYTIGSAVVCFDGSWWLRIGQAPPVPQ